MSSWQVTIHVKNSNITCRPKGGSIHAKHGDEVRWFSPDAAFSLVFTDFDSGNLEWPFVDAQATAKVTNTTDTGVLTINNAFPRYYKYVVQSAGCEELDPVIIVDK